MGRSTAPTVRIQERDCVSLDGVNFRLTGYVCPHLQIVFIKKGTEDERVCLRETRQQRDLELRADRTLMRNIIHTWRQIKDLRTFQQFTNTTVKLQIKK